MGCWDGWTGSTDGGIAEGTLHAGVLYVRARRGKEQLGTCLQHGWSAYTPTNPHTRRAPQEASYAWQRRQSEIRRRVAEATSSAAYSAPRQPAAKKAGWGFWNNAVEFGAAAGSQ